MMNKEPYLNECYYRNQQLCLDEKNELQCIYRESWRNVYICKCAPLTLKDKTIDE